MTEFGQNGSVIGAATNSTSYSIPIQPKLKRVGLASFLCGVAACVTVALIGLLTAFLYYQIASVFTPQVDAVLGSDGLMSGAAMATLMAAMNWYVGYITIPVAWLVLGLSLGRFPKRKIVGPVAYYRWGAIWGAILVGGTTAIATALIGGQSQIAPVIGALLTGLSIGALSGLICGWLFLAIVRPAEQVRRIAVEVF